MVTAKKPAARKVVAKKTVKPVARKVATRTVKATAQPVTKPSKLAILMTEPVVIKHVFNRTDLIAHLVEVTQLDKKDVLKVLNTLTNTMLGSLQPRGVGEFTLPGMFKVFLRKVPARRAGVMVRNPGTGEMIKGKAKPASVRVKMRPLSKLRQAALA